MHPLRSFVSSHVPSGARRHRTARRMLFSATNIAIVLALAVSILFMHGKTALAQVPPGAVFTMLTDTVFNGDNHIEVTHDPAFQLAQGTFALRFTPDDAARKQALFSKDFTGNRGGGDITALIQSGRIKVRFQSATDTVWAYTPEGSIQPGQEYHLAVTFGPDGLWVHINGQIMAVQPRVHQDLQQNTNNMAIGASTWSRTTDKPDVVRDYYRGRISDFMLFSSPRQFASSRLQRER